MSFTRVLLAGAIGLAAVTAGAAPAHAAAAQRAALTSSAELRATGLVGEQANGYLGVVGQAAPDLRARVSAINIRRRAAYSGIAGRRGVTVEEVAATMACVIFATSVLPGQYYRLPDGVWRRRQGNARIERPAYCI